MRDSANADAHDLAFSGPARCGLGLGFGARLSEPQPWAWEPASSSWPACRTPAARTGSPATAGIPGRRAAALLSAGGRLVLGTGAGAEAARAAWSEADPPARESGSSRPAPGSRAGGKIEVLRAPGRQGDLGRRVGVELLVEGRRLRASRARPPFAWPAWPRRCPAMSSPRSWYCSIALGSSLRASSVRALPSAATRRLGESLARALADLVEQVERLLEVRQGHVAGCWAGRRSPGCNNRVAACSFAQVAAGDSGCPRRPSRDRRAYLAGLELGPELARPGVPVHNTLLDDHMARTPARRRRSSPRTGSGSASPGASTAPGPSCSLRGRG